MGNPTALLVERIFWLGLGLFLCLSIFTSLIRTFNERNRTIDGVFNAEVQKEPVKEEINQNKEYF